MSQSNLPLIQRLKWEDYASATSWQTGVQALLNNLNLFITPAYNIFNANVGYQNLVAPQLFTKVIVAATPTTFTFVNPLQGISPSAVILGNAWSGIPSVHPAVALQVFWHVQGNTIVIDNIVGLSAGTQYSITLVIF
jgi:hypothetical protein